MWAEAVGLEKLKLPIDSEKEQKLLVDLVVSTSLPRSSLKEVDGSGASKDSKRDILITPFQIIYFVLQFRDVTNENQILNYLFVEMMVARLVPVLLSIGGWVISIH